jgi:multidrug efflux pump subunit AcrA (membrane-fusion protein)
MKKRVLLLLPVAVFAVGALLMFVFLGMREDQARRVPQPRTRIVDAIVVRPGDVVARIEAYGTVRSAQPVEVFSEVSGTLIKGDVAFRPAQTFQAGDVLIRIDDRQAHLDRNSAVSELLNALASVLPEIKVDSPEAFGEWQTYFDQVRFDRKLPDLPEAATPRIKLFLSRYNVYKLFFAVQSLDIRLEKHTIRAPFDGTIVETDLRVGSTARVNSRLGVIINLDAFEVEVPLAAGEVPWIDFDGPVSFASSQFDGAWQGQIRRVGRYIEQQTQTIPVYVELSGAHAGALPQGVFFETRLPGKVVPDAVEIPRRALYQERFVYLVRDGQLEFREVDIVREQKETVIAQGGLIAGDTLVVEPLQGVAAGMLAQARISSSTEPGS